MPGTATATASKQSHFTKHNRTNSRLSNHSRNSSSTKLHHAGAGHHTLAFTALKQAEPIKRTDSTTSVRSDHTTVSGKNGLGQRPALTTRKSTQMLPAKKPKFLIPVEPQDADEDEDDEDDDDQWVSSGVVTPDDRELQEEEDMPSLPPGLRTTPMAMPEQRILPDPEPPSPVPGPSSVPNFDPIDRNFHKRSSGHKTAPSSRPPSVTARLSSRLSTHGPPSLIRTSSFTPTQSTAPPLMTTSIASAQITSTNTPEALSPAFSPTPSTSTNAWKGIASLYGSPPSSPISSASRPLRRSSISSAHSNTTLPAAPHPNLLARERKQSTYSTASTTNAHASSSKHSAAFNSLSAIPHSRSTPPPLVSHFPPVPDLTLEQQAFNLLPPPYLAAHMAVRSFESPLQDAFARVVLGRPKPSKGRA